MRIVARLTAPDSGEVLKARDVYLERVYGDAGREHILCHTGMSREQLDRELVEWREKLPDCAIVEEPPGNLAKGFKWPGWECPGLRRGGIAPKCCPRAGEYGEFGVKFKCAVSCPCHD